MPRGRPPKGREQYIRIKLRTSTHLTWITRKKSLGIKSDDALACYFLENSVPDESFSGGSERVEEDKGIHSANVTKIVSYSRYLIFS